MFYFFPEIQIKITIIISIAFTYAKTKLIETTEHDK